MRTLKFRGLCLNGKDWHVGNLSILMNDVNGVKAGTYISNKVGVPFAYAVRPETVGQYTGFKDSTTWEQLTEDERTKFVRNGGMPSEWEGKDIYEMDIVKVAKKVEDSEGYYSHTAKFSACVEFEHGSFMVGFLKLFEPDIYDSHPECLKIIGNKFENPELLK